MSNSQFKRSEAEHHNEMYAAQRYREQHNLPEWQDVSNRQKMRDLFPTDGVEGCPNLDEIKEVQITAATESKITEQQAVGRSERSPKDIAVIGAGQTGFGKAARRILVETALGNVAKQIAFATPEMLGEMGREQAREHMRKENGRYGKGF
jgi:hypothetical protein